MKPIIWWIRRDLRLSDNPALLAALESGSPLIPLFVVDPRLWTVAQAGEKRLSFLRASLQALDGALRERGSRLQVQRGDPLHALGRVAQQASAEAVFAEADFSPYARRRDEQVGRAIGLKLVAGPALQPPGSVLTAAGKPYAVFSPFARAWREQLARADLEPLAAPDSLPSVPQIAADPLPRAGDLPAEFAFTPGEALAQARLEAFTQGPDPPVHRYAQQRDRLDLESTSQLSPYLRFGMLSARQAVRAALDAIAAAPDAAAEEGAQAWLSELIWREFYMHVLYHHPQVLGGPLQTVWSRIRWSDDRTAFEAWCLGMTGYPVVDAAMRQLRATGWIHNRARMIAASFLVKHLLIDWRWGERWFMRHLVDADLAANNGGWQWVAGTGADAAPYFRVFNPTLQGKKFDPQGNYIRRWVPELVDVPERAIHEPHRSPGPSGQRLRPVSTGSYPAPIVDHRQARERALAAYRAARESA